MKLQTWHRAIWQQMTTERESGRLPHAILFHGPKAAKCGEFALMLGHSLLCENPQPEACGVCKACRQLAAGANPDWIQIQRLEEKKEILIDQIRDFCTNAYLTASRETGRVGLIFEADKLNANAANALLKTLEEPPSSLVILMTATRLSRVLPTIRSRCRCIAMPQPDDNELRAMLGADANQFSSAQLHAIAGLSADPELHDAVIQKQRQWACVLDELRQQQDPIQAAAQVEEGDFDAFLEWWQRSMLEQIRHDQRRIALKQVWDETCRLRRLAQSGNFKHLLALEGLFMLYLQLQITAKQGVA